jgi:hypothetical protein
MDLFEVVVGQRRGEDMSANRRAKASGMSRKGRRRFAAKLEHLETRQLLSTLIVNSSNTTDVEDGSESHPYATIQAAIDHANIDGGDTIRVEAGVYREAITVDRPVEILGPNENVDTSGTRGPEAVILPPVNNPEAGVNVLVEASNVVIAGLDIDGHVEGMDGGETYNGVSINAGSGISNVDSLGKQYAISGLTVRNNLIENFVHFGVIVDGGEPSSPTSPSDGNTISDNTIDNIPYIASSPIRTAQGRAISIENNVRASVIGNVISRAATGIQAIFSILPISSNAITEIRDNVVSDYDRGIFVYTQDAGMPTFAITGNTVSTESTGATATNIGIDIDRVLDITTGTIADNDVNGAAIGIRLDYDSTTAGLTVTGGTLTGNGYGVVLTNADPIDSSTGSKPLQASLEGVTIRDSKIAGLLVEDTIGDSNSTVTLSVDAATTATNNLDSVVLSGPGAHIVDAGLPTVTFTTTPPAVTGSTSATFKVSASDNLTPSAGLKLQYTLDDNPAAQTSGTFKLTDLSAGVHTVVVSATDEFGNTSSATYRWTVSASTPSAPSTPTLSASSDTGVSSSDGITRDNTPTFMGTAPAGSTVTVYANAKVLGQTVALSDGTWSFTVTHAMSDGKYDIAARVTDSDGRVSGMSGSARIVVDTAAPKVSAAAVALPLGLFDMPRDPVAFLGKVSPSLSGITDASYTLRDSSGRVAASGSIKIGRDGSFWGLFLVDAPRHGLSVYMLTLNVQDAAGNVGQTNVVVVAR